MRLDVFGCVMDDMIMIDTSAAESRSFECIIDVNIGIRGGLGTLKGVKGKGPCMVSEEENP